MQISIFTIEDDTGQRTLEQLIADVGLHAVLENLRYFHNFSLFSIRKKFEQKRWIFTILYEFVYLRGRNRITGYEFVLSYSRIRIRSFRIRIRTFRVYILTFKVQIRTYRYEFVPPYLQGICIVNSHYLCTNSHYWSTNSHCDTPARPPSSWSCLPGWPR